MPSPCLHSPTIAISRAWLGVESVSVLLWLFQKVLDLHALAIFFSFHNFSSQQHRKQHLQYCGYMCSKSLNIPLLEHL
jgi:hypothetical protein